MVSRFCQQGLTLSTFEKFPNYFLLLYWQNLVRSGVNDWTELSGVDFHRGHRLEHLFGRSCLTLVLRWRLLFDHSGLVSFLLILGHGPMIYLDEVVRFIIKRTLLSCFVELWVSESSLWWAFESFDGGGFGRRCWKLAGSGSSAGLLTLNHCAELFYILISVQ